MNIHPSRKRIACITGSFINGGAGYASNVIINIMSNYYDVDVFSRETVQKNNIRYLFFRVFNFTFLKFFYFIQNQIIDKKFIWSRNFFGLFGYKSLSSTKFDMYFIFSLSYPIVSDRVLERILKSGKPVFWRLSDMRPFTSGCHYSNTCTQFVVDCINCPAIIRFNNLTSIFFLKNYHNALRSNNIHLLFPSIWLLDKFKLMNHGNTCSSTQMPTMVNPIFKVRNNNNDNLDILNSSNKKLILFGADNFENNLRKGFQQFLDFVEYCHSIPDFFENFKIFCYGTSSNFQVDNNIKFLGKLSQSDLSNVLNKVDLYVNISLEDNLPNVVMEALACGTRVVTTRVGGIDELQNELPEYVSVFSYGSHSELMNLIKMEVSKCFDRLLISRSFYKNHSDFIMHDFLRKLENY